MDVASGEAKQVTDGQDWNDDDPQWSPDSTRIAFVSDRTGKLFDESHNTDVWVISAAGGTLTKVSDNEFEDESPRWSPEGKRIIFTGKTAYHQFFKLYVADLSGHSSSQMVLKDLDVIPTELHWPQAGTALFVAAIKGESHIFRGDPSGQTFSAVTDKGRLSARLGVTHNDAYIYQYIFADGADLGIHGPLGDTYIYAHTQVDLQGSYRLHGGLKFIASMLNLNNEVFGFYQGSPIYPSQREFYGPTFMFGFRWTNSKD